MEACIIFLLWYNMQYALTILLLLLQYWLIIHLWDTIQLSKNSPKFSKVIAAYQITLYFLNVNALLWVKWKYSWPTTMIETFMLNLNVSNSSASQKSLTCFWKQTRNIFALIFLLSNKRLVRTLFGMQICLHFVAATVGTTTGPTVSLSGSTGSSKWQHVV